jgi:hypothetical protein
VGVHPQRSGNRHALLLPARKLRRVMIGAVHQPDPFQLPHGLLMGLLGRHLQHFGHPNRHVLQRSEMVKQVEILEDHPDALADFIDVDMRGSDLLLFQPDAPLIRSGEQVDAAQQRALAGAAWPDDDHNFFFLHFQRDALDNLVVRVSLVQVFNAEECLIAHR